MSEEVVKTENDLSDEDKKKLELIRTKLAEGMRFICPKHGDCTDDNLYLSYLDVDHEKKQVYQVKHIYCSHCLDDLLQDLVAQGKLQDVKVGVSKAALKDLGIEAPEDPKEAKAEETKAESNEDSKAESK